MEALENVVIPSELTAPEDLEVETPARILLGWTGRLAMVLSIILSVYALYWVVGIVQPLVYRASFLLLVLVLGFLYYPARPESKSRVTALDWLFALLSIAACLWPIVDFQDFIYRAADPTTVDVVLGTICVVLVLEATRRTAGWVLPVTAAAFLAYSYYGPLLDLVGLGIIAHRGYDLSRTIGTTYMTLEGIFGVPLDVAATYIVLFAIYGAVLEASGAGKFFLEWSLAAVGRSGGGAGPGRAVTIAGGLLGTVSGSGVATTVTLGSVGWPLLKRSGYDPDTAGAMLSAAGIGAIISPPTLGAAAFIIAEFLHISYLKVLVMSSIPCLLYFLSIFVMIEADARRAGARAVPVTLPPLWHLTKRYGYHFLTLLAIPVLLAFGMSTFRAVVYSMIVALILSWVDKENRVGWRKLMHALYSGGRATLPVAATTATAGIIVGTVTLTGLGLKMSGLIVDVAGGYLFLTVFYSAIAIWILGLAVPVTASYIIAAVMVAPAMVKVGVPDLAAHMFIFYYAVLSEVSPPTALAPVAAAALCGGRPVRTMMLTWKYTLPAFVFPFAFTLSKQGMGLLLQAPLGDVVMSTGTAIVGILALGAGLGGWIRQEANALERTLATAGGLLLFYAGSLSDLAGLVLFGIAIALHMARTRVQLATSH
jgi:TRAP transporter 4TM/12TM fusion protein